MRRCCPSRAGSRAALDAFPDSDAELWRRTVAAIGTPAAALAREIGVDPRTARRWLEGKPMSASVRSLCRVLIAMPSARRFL